MKINGYPRSSMLGAEKLKDIILVIRKQHFAKYIL